MVADTLRQAIIEGALPAGDALRQDHLASAFQISRMPVREALRQLEAEELVEFLPHRGSIVATLDAAEILEVFELRELLECHALKKAIANMDDAVLSRAGEVLDEIDREPDVAKWGELNRRFHLILYTSLRGSRLHALVEAQYLHLDRMVRLVLSQLDYAERSQAGAPSIASALP